jgi:hypothetical protein
MDTLQQLYDKYIKALTQEATFMLDQLDLSPFALQMLYEEAFAADLRGDTVWRDQILSFSHNSIYVA